MKDKSLLLGLFLCVITCQTFAQSLVDQVIYTVDKKYQLILIYRLIK